MRFAPVLILAAMAAPLAAQPIVQEPLPASPLVGQPAALEVQRLAPQLVAFAGSQANFNSLVNALSLGAPVTLETIGADGMRQLVTFTPNLVPMTPVEIARTLESARQDLIVSGIARPSAQQLAVALTGGQVPVSTLEPATPAAATQPVSPAAELQSRIGAGSTAPAAEQSFVRRGNTSDSPILGNTSDTPRLSPNPAVVAPAQGAAPQVVRRPAPTSAPARDGNRPRLRLGR